MYFDNTFTERRGWKYTYKGSDLLEPAKRKLAAVQAEETEVRDNVAKLLQNRQVNARCKDVTDLEKMVVSLSEDHEMLLVLVHEFGRTPDREFRLALGDVVFLGLTSNGGE